MKRITFSFKNTLKDKALLSVLDGKEDKSYHIKKALRAYYKAEYEAELKRLETISSDDFDFDELIKNIDIPNV